MDFQTLISLYDGYNDAVSELDSACNHFYQAVVDLHSYDISLIGTIKSLRSYIDGLEEVYQMIVSRQATKDEELN